MGLQTLKTKAKVYLETAKGNTAPIEQLMSQLKELIAQNKVLQENLTAANAAKKTKESA
jgi:hypothetical protein